MRILFVYTGSAHSMAVRSKEGFGLPADLDHLETTHMSEVNHLLICHWLRELGHSISVYTHTPVMSATHFPEQDWSDDPYDCLFLFKVHGCRVAAQKHIIGSQKWPMILAWFDSSSPGNILGAQAAEVTHWAWGTRRLQEGHEGLYPKARHISCEHATTFWQRPALQPPAAEGVPAAWPLLYAGRLPEAYLQTVEMASKTLPVHAYALWVERGGEKILLRPWQLKRGDTPLQRAQALVEPSVRLETAVNMSCQAHTLAQHLAAICPATGGTKQQLNSASKFFDYAALGLPTILADNTPEADHVRACPYLGELFVQGDPESLQHAIKASAQAQSDPAQALAIRQRIQNWAFAGQTYKHRAQQLHEFITEE